MIIQIVLDKAYAGFYYKISNKVCSLCLGYFAIRLYFVSERTLSKACYLYEKQRYNL